MKTNKLLLSSFAGVLLLWQTAISQTFTHVGNAVSIGSNCHQLTADSAGQVGAIWSTTTLDLSQNFIIQFTANFGSKDVFGADGITFVLQTDINGNSALGGSGGDLGYSDPNISPSLDIEFDTFRNSVDASSNDHISFHSNGDQMTFLTSPRNLPDLEDGNDHTITIHWNAMATIMTADIDGRRLSITNDIVNTIFGGQQNVMWGLTSATGARSNRHVVCFDEVCQRPDFTVAIGEDFPIAPGQEERGNSVKEVGMPGCGYIIAGSSQNIVNGQDKMLLVRTNDDGTVAWARKYELTLGNYEAELMNVEVLQDGFIVTGWVNIIGRDMIIMRVDDVGNPIWAKVYTENHDQEGVDIEVADNGDFVVVGRSHAEVLLVRVQSNGAHVWGRTFGNSIQVWRGTSLVQTEDDGDGIVDDGFILCGTRQFLFPPADTSDMDWIIIKTDSQGHLSWAESFTGSQYDDEPFTIQQMDVDGDAVPDTNRFAVGGYLTVTVMGSQREDGLLVFDTHAPSGFNYNSVLYSDGLNDSRINSLEQTLDHGFILSGALNETASTNRDAFLVKTNLTGNVTWANEYGAPNRDDWALSVEEVIEDGYVFTGVTHSFQLTNQHIFHVKTDGTGNAPCLSTPSQIGDGFHPMQTNLEIPDEGNFELYFDDVPAIDAPVIDFHDCTSTRLKSPNGREGIAEKENDNTVGLYPNPVKLGEPFNVQRRMRADNGQSILSLYNNLGQLVFQKNVLYQEGLLQISISTNEFVPGLYHLSIQEGKEVDNSKVLIE